MKLTIRMIADGEIIMTRSTTATSTKDQRKQSCVLLLLPEATSRLSFMNRLLLFTIANNSSGFVFIAPMEQIYEDVNNRNVCPSKPIRFHNIFDPIAPELIRIRKIRSDYTKRSKKQKNNTRDSNVVPHRSTNLAR